MPTDFQRTSPNARCFLATLARTDSIVRLMPLRRPSMQREQCTSETQHHSPLKRQWSFAFSIGIDESKQSMDPTLHSHQISTALYAIIYLKANNGIVPGDGVYNREFGVLTTINMGHVGQVSICLIDAYCRTWSVGGIMNPALILWAPLG